MDLKIAGKVAVVTGSGRGIGAQTVRTLAEEGARVVVTDINEETARETAARLSADGHEAIGVKCDVCRREDVDALVAAATKAYGGVDILVNNAGFTRDQYLGKMSEDDWDAVVDTIIKGAFHCSRAVLPGMMQKRWGRIVNIASRSVFGNPGQTNYTTAKLGLVGFTRALSLEQAKFGITVNAIAPGFVETELMRSLPTYERLRDGALARNPVGFLGQPGDIADAVAFIASERARYITGVTLYVTGGRFSS
ncbi:MULTISPECIES: SDR family NAD(P)-dependent oxidoreductase [Bordetella]|uniref:Beta-ketoacyl-ACP reductase n=1 Tax=Bordetella genomosp. 6 TaxID=463024 RepID=A0ABX4F994_9BORD|nr:MULTISPECIES: SDR family NAD(P)-dependent oxidoreductase [Bordetella]AOB25742.1 beta-ketoacyl-ACP reductase [Bordetella bronchiseptica]AWP73989.1 beta-ketoacyl-ACP reductase [Bordetella bronchiseptica]AZW43004.1 NAD(P)-dependent oxidoreductase [Bordetella bronchiseptica]KCV62532.1 KR domain protein [Bordetella bronchiseptica 99-R-0433]KDB66628.1 KR domain protein [Bordetella bronchiseptica A1-7]